MIETAVEKSRGRVLVCDDNEMNVEVFRQELEDAGFDVVTATSGPECIRLAAQSKPEVVLLDVAMPGMDGIETCKRLKQESETSHIPVTFISAYRSTTQSIIDALEAGGNDFLLKPYHAAILVARLMTQIEICRAHLELIRQATTDDLTNTFSRRYLFEYLRRVVRHHGKMKIDALACLMVDVDKFKHVNDSYGHRAGDQALIKVASTIKKSVRDSDLVARLGGDEFTVVVPNTELDAVLAMAERIRADVEQFVPVVTTSIGVSRFETIEFPTTLDEKAVERQVDEILVRADKALYRAKDLGRNRIEVAGAGDHSEASD